MQVHAQVKYILGMQKWFIIKILVNVIHKLKTYEEKAHYHLKEWKIKALHKTRKSTPADNIGKEA
jgi:hypothetical protein